MMYWKRSVVSAMLLSSPARAARKLSYTQIAGFDPQSNVNDHLSIDLDQQAMEEQLGFLTADSFAAARKIYEQGGNSKSYAMLTLVNPLSVSAATTDSLTGQTAAGLGTYGSPMDPASDGDTTVNFLYTVSEDIANDMVCHVGGLLEPVTTGCLAPNGTISMSGSAQQIQYTYDPLTDNQNARTLQYFSTTADQKMRANGTGPYYKDFQTFLDYYGSVTYADDYVTAAFQASTAGSSNAPFNFASYDYDARAEAIEKATAYMATAMYSIRELENGLDECLISCRGDTCTDPDQSLDEAVAFYTGSLEGADGSGQGVLFYSLADKRCANFKTCGENGDELTGTAWINLEIFKNFREYEANWAAEKCSDARKNKEAIAKLMKVPLIQGTLRYAYLGTTDYTPKGEAEGATFAASVLPWVNACSPSDAKTIYDYMKPGSGSDAKKFSTVKAAFERNYRCLGVSCAMVGGYIDTATNEYVQGGAPCASGATSMVVVGVSFIGSFIIAIMAMF